MAASSSVEQNRFGWRDAALALTSVLLLLVGWLRVADMERLEQRIESGQQLTDERCRVVWESIADIRRTDSEARTRIDKLEAESKAAASERAAHLAHSNRYTDKIDRIDREQAEVMRQLGIRINGGMK